MKTLIILFTVFSITACAQSVDSLKTAEYDSVKIADLQKEIENLKALNTNNETQFNEVYRNYFETQKNLNLLFTEKNNKLNALLDKKKKSEEKGNGKNK